MNKISRRNFFGKAACAAMGSTTLLNTLVNLSMTNNLVAAPSMTTMGGDYKALVCILLAGGNDSFNMLIPNETSTYNTYEATRTNLSIPQIDLLPINDANGTAFGLHPNLGGVQSLYNDGKLSFVANVGTLVERINNASEYYSGLKNVPLGLYSHSDQTQQWQTSLPTQRTTIGWGGRMADILSNPNSNVSMNISLDGRNVWQAGNSVIEYAIDNVNGSNSYGQFRWQYNAGLLNDIRNGAVENMMAAQYSNVFKQTFGSLTSTSLEAHEEFSRALGVGDAVNTPFSNTRFSQDLRMVARTIGARHSHALDVSRQTFFVALGGFDNHDNLLPGHGNLMTTLNAGLSEFYTALEELGVADCVTTFSISDFARTLTTNGNGSDHSWGGNQFVMGGAVQAINQANNGGNGHIYGTYPDLTTSSDLAIDERGTLIPTLSTDEYFAELAMWFGVSRTNQDLYSILENIGNFYSPSPSVNPIGFLPV